ncbi:MAG: serine/threonine-protein phosphatase [Gammaproteobacteria bacterium]|jgi:PPM family protein phosphatase|nr:serine/threonine-protein phosphatase [Gammaproteobacteria bacterium]
MRYPLSNGGVVNVFGVTDVGLKRPLNEDSFLVDGKLGLMLLADGMGGHDSGEVASLAAITTIHTDIQRAILRYEEEAQQGSGFHEPEDYTLDGFDPPHVNWLTAAIAQANDAIFQQNRQRGFAEGLGMGTTLVGCWLMEEGRMTIFHVGDSRFYLQRRGEPLQRLTQDHSLLREWEVNGGLGERPRRNILSRSIGPTRGVQPEITHYPPKDGDILLLTSDGLTSLVADEQISMHLRGVSSLGVEPVCNQLVEAANRAGGSDNVTVVVAEVKIPSLR